MCHFLVSLNAWVNEKKVFETPKIASDDPDNYEISAVKHIDPLVIRAQLYSNWISEYLKFFAPKPRRITSKDKLGYPQSVFANHVLVLIPEKNSRNKTKRKRCTMCSVKQKVTMTSWYCAGCGIQGSRIYLCKKVQNNCFWNVPEHKKLPNYVPN